MQISNLLKSTGSYDYRLSCFVRDSEVWSSISSSDHSIIIVTFLSKLANAKHLNVKYGRMIVLIYQHYKNHC